jgi:spore coat polysaccharide biosynthesis predicted glycosyltransferase SpsG
MTPAVVLRADASHGLGFGHVARLCALAEELADRGAQPIAMFGGDAALAAWLAANGIAGEARPWAPDELVAAAAAPHVCAVVLDGPALARTLGPGLIARGVRTIIVDDVGPCELAAFAIVNHNFHAPSLAAGYPAAHARLLGRDYLLLRRAFRRLGRGACQPRSPDARHRLRVVVSFGGSDPVGATARTLRALPAEHALDVVALAGPGFRDTAALGAAAATAAAAGHTVEIVRAPDDAAPLFAQADAAICSAGGTLGELAYLGCPALAFAIAPDQLAAADAQVRAGLVAGGRAWSDLTEGADHALRADLLAFLLDEPWRRDLRDRALATVDGGGPARVVAAALAQASASVR